MISITDTAELASALDSPLDRTLKGLLALRLDQLLCDTDGQHDLAELVHFIIVEPPDSIAELEAVAGYPVVTQPAFEWVAHHDGWYEAVTILSDDGFGIALFVADHEGADPALLSLLREQAVPAFDSDRGSR